MKEKAGGASRFPLLMKERVGGGCGYLIEIFNPSFISAFISGRKCSG
jgi:hypothetical protein